MNIISMVHTVGKLFPTSYIYTNSAYKKNMSVCFTIPGEGNFQCTTANVWQVSPKGYLKRTKRSEEIYEQIKQACQDVYVETNSDLLPISD